MDKIKLIKERANIVEVAKYLNINLNYANKACCPFHKEKTASFSISVNKQIFKCFGCGKGGDVISLVSELLNINSYEASKLVNDICNCGVDLTRSVSKYEVEKYKYEQHKKEQNKQYVNSEHNRLCEFYREINNAIRVVKSFDVLADMYKTKVKLEYLLEVLETEPESYKEVARIWKT